MRPGSYTGPGQVAQSGLRGGASHIYLGVPTIRSLIYALLPAGATTVIAVHCSAVVQDMHRPPVRLRAYHRCMLVRCCHVLQRCGTAVLVRSAGALLHCGMQRAPVMPGLRQHAALSGGPLP
jgi:hypothetical protein